MHEKPNRNEWKPNKNSSRDPKLAKNQAEMYRKPNRNILEIEQKTQSKLSSDPKLYRNQAEMYQKPITIKQKFV